MKPQNLLKQSLFRRFVKQRDGNLVVEFAFLASILGLLLMGVLDFGLAYSREMAMSNAVRAGTQFALVRRPSIGDGADAQAALVSQTNIKTAVVDAAPFLASDPGEPALTVEVFCECADNTITACLSEDATPISCNVRFSYLRVALELPYEMIFTIPGIGNQMTLRTEHVIRLT